MSQGPRDTSSLVLLTGYDATTIHRFTTADGISYGQIVANMNAALTTLNAELANDSLFSSLVSYTDQPTTEYRVGTSNGFDDFTEWGRADSARAATEGHTIPLLKKDRRLGWSWSYLKDARLSQIQADFADALYDARSLWRKAVLKRLLQRGDDAVGSGFSPGFATAAASTSVDFVPPSYNGTDFTSAHEHYVGIGGGVFTTAVFSDAFDELREHGHGDQGSLEFLIGPSDRATVEGLTGFVPVADPLIEYGTTESVARGAMADGYIGSINHFRVREVRGIPQYYGVAYASYGPNSQRNPLRVRLERGITAPRIVLMTDPTAGTANNPLQSLMLYVELGVGVADRTGATPRYVNNATWADGTAT